MSDERAGAAEPADEEILAALAARPDDFALFYRRHVRGLLGYLLRRTGDAELAADLCAETFAAALSGARRFDPGRGPAVGWRPCSAGSSGRATRSARGSSTA